MEAEAFLAAMKGMKLPDGRDRQVRHGHGRVRTIQTGIGAVEVARVKIRDRAAPASGFASRRRLLCRGLGPFADDESHRKRVRGNLPFSTAS